MPKKRGGQREYSDFAITSFVTLGLVFKQRLRQTEGLVQSLIKLMNLYLKTPTFRTISVRSKGLETQAFIKRSSEAVVIAIGTGLKIYGEQEWHIKLSNAT